MTSFRPSKTSGFTLIELVLVIALAAILYTFTLGNIGSNDDAARYEQTRARMEALRIAILGQTSSTDTEGTRRNFGYWGDVGALPTTLTDLVTKPAAVGTYAISGTYGIGAGWRGPYIASTAITGSKAFDVDGWGRQFTYTIAGVPSITSLGSDNTAAGTGFASDLVMQLPVAQRLSTISGLLENFNARVGGATIEMAYPSAGALVTSSTLTLDNGVFAFSGIPFGVRAIRVTAPSVQVARQLIVDRASMSLPASLLNFFGSTEAVTLVASSTFFTAAQARVFASLSSTYTADLLLNAVTATFPDGGTLDTIVLNGASESFSGITSGSRADASSDMILKAGSSTNTIELRFSTPQVGGNVQLIFEWQHRTRTDTVSIAV